MLASTPGLQVTPQVLLQFIAMQTTMEPRQSPDDSPPPDADQDERGRSEDRDEDGINSRSSSRDSTATYYRSSSRGPQTPQDSVFDSGRRQRTTPLKNNAPPSTWSRRPPPRRRKSDAGHSRASSDSEVRSMSLIARTATATCRSLSNRILSRRARTTWNIVRRIVMPYKYWREHCKALYPS